MAKKEKNKSEGRKPTLAEFVDSSFKIYLNHGGKEYEATVLSSGMVRYNDQDYTSPSAIGAKIVGVAVNGWRAWKFNKDGERVELNVLRGSKSPLKIVEAKKPRKPKAEKKAKAPRKPRKPRAKKSSSEAAAPEQAVAAAD